MCGIASATTLLVFYIQLIGSNVEICSHGLPNVEFMKMPSETNIIGGKQRREEKRELKGEKSSLIHFFCRLVVQYEIEMIDKINARLTISLVPMNTKKVGKVIKNL